MDDKAFDELKLRATIVPQQVRWPAAEYVHWQKLHAVADEARERVSKAYSLMDDIDRNADLSRDGKERQRFKAAVQAIADFEASKTLARAREAVTRVIEQWNAKVGLTVKAASNINEATIHAQIRDRVAAMKSGRMGFLEKNAVDPVVASAILTAPAFLSGLSDVEFAVVKQKVEQHVSPEIAEARAATLKAMKEAEQGWQKAINKIGERAGLTRGADGTWCSPSTSEAATT
jgi:hypothetical protein